MMPAIRKHMQDGLSNIGPDQKMYDIPSIDKMEDLHQLLSSVQKSGVPSVNWVREYRVKYWSVVY